jgi:hypothetical protein
MRVFGEPSLQMRLGKTGPSVTRFLRLGYGGIAVVANFRQGRFAHRCRH